MQKTDPIGTPKRLFAVGLFIVVLFIATRYQKIIEFVSTNGVGVLIFIVLGTGAIWAYRRFGRNLSDEPLSKGGGGRTRPNDENW